MLESLGYAESPRARRGRPHPLQHVLDPRGGRQPLRRPPAPGQGRQARAARGRHRRRRLLGAVGQGRRLPPVPVRRRRLRPRPGPQAGRVPDLRLAHGAGLLRVRRLHRPPPGQARPRVPGLGADLGRLQLPLLVLHRALHARPRGLAPVRRARRGGPRAGRRRRARGDAAGPERQLLRARPAAGAPLVRRAAARARRHRGARPPALHQPASQGHARGRGPRPRRARLGVRAHPPSAAVGLEHDPQGDAPHLRPWPLPGPRRAHPRARARLRDHDRHHRRLSRARPSRTSSRRWRYARRSATTAPSPSSSRRAGAPRRRLSPRASCRTRSRWRAWSASSRSSSGAPRERAQRFVGRTLDVLVEGPSRTDPSRIRGRSRHGKTVNFTGLAAPGEIVAVEIHSATSTSLAGEESLLSRAAA